MLIVKSNSVLRERRKDISCRVAHLYTLKNSISSSWASNKRLLIESKILKQKLKLSKATFFNMRNPISGYDFFFREKSSAVRNVFCNSFYIGRFFAVNPGQFGNWDINDQNASGII